MPLETPTVMVENAARANFELKERDFAIPERQISSQEGRFDLDHDDEINPDVWADTTPPTYELPEQAKVPLTHAQELEIRYNYCDNKQLVAIARDHSHSIVSGLRAHYTLAA